MTISTARLARVAAPAAVLAGAASLALAGSAAPAGAAPLQHGAPAAHHDRRQSGSQTFFCNNTATPQPFLVPAGVFSVTIQAFGANGASGTGAPGGSGGVGGGRSTTLSVTPGQTLSVLAGCVGTNAAGGVPDGGAPGASDAGGGGGSSSVKSGSATLVIAGGGGGGGGSDVCTPTAAGGSGGTGGNLPAAAGGTGGSCSPAAGGTGGNSTGIGAGGAGGSGGTGGNAGSDGQAASGGTGGQGGNGAGSFGDGGGGGGGQTGGGGGGGGGDNVGNANAGGGGGGGGLSAILAGKFRHSLPRSDARHTRNIALGDGQVTISWRTPPPPPPPPPPPRRADLAISLSHLGKFKHDRDGQYSMLVTNTSNRNTSGTITVTLSLPSGMKMVFGGSGTWWQCHKDTSFSVCTRTGTLKAHASTTITARVHITAPAGSFRTATATVKPLDSTPGDNTGKDTAFIFRS